MSEKSILSQWQVKLPKNLCQMNMDVKSTHEGSSLGATRENGNTCQLRCSKIAAEGSHKSRWSLLRASAPKRRRRARQTHRSGLSSIQRQRTAKPHGQKHQPGAEKCNSSSRPCRRSRCPGSRAAGAQGPFTSLLNSLTPLAGWSGVVRGAPGKARPRFVMLVDNAAELRHPQQMEAPVAESEESDRSTRQVKHNSTLPFEMMLADNLRRQLQWELHAVPKKLSQSSILRKLNDL